MYKRQLHECQTDATSSKVRAHPKSLYFGACSEFRANGPKADATRQVSGKTSNDKGAIGWREFIEAEMFLIGPLAIALSLIHI